MKQADGNLRIVICLDVVLLCGCSPDRGKEKPTSPPVEPAVARINEPIRPIPIHTKANEKKVALGDKLFHDPRLSPDNSTTCASCHNLNTGGTDRKVRSIGPDGAASEFNAPTVLNSVFNFRQFWDGRAETLEDCIDGPTHNPQKISYNWPEIISKLKQDSNYGSAFGELYSGGIQSRNVKDVIATFVRGLHTPNSRFDQYLRGDNNALTSEEREGYRIFKVYGCTRCHQGLGVGGNMFETFGVMRDYFNDRGNITRSDLGRYNTTGDVRDRHQFKVPSLRNVALTSPYFHDGSVRTLEEAVAVMARYQLGRVLTEKEIDLILKFLHTLTGQFKGRSLEVNRR